MLQSNEVLQGNFARSRGFSVDHNGVDLAAPNGTPVLSRRSGIVKVCGTNPVGKDFGNYIRVYEPSVNLSSWYAHLQGYNCSVGQSVGAGQVIAHSNNTGQTTGPHLHYGESTGESLNWIDPDTTGGEDMNTPETNEILYKTILGQPQGTAGDAGAATNLNKPLEEVIKFMWNTQAAKDFQTWLSTVRDQFPKLQATVDDLRASFVKQTEEMDSMDKQITAQGQTINGQEDEIAKLEKQVASLSTQLQNASSTTSSGLAVPTLSSVLESIRVLLKKWIGGG